MAEPSVVERSIEIAAPVEDVFTFHLDTRNAARISPRSTKVLRVYGSFPVVTGSRVVMVMRQWPSPFPMSWRVRIETVERPARIVDVAERSPFAAWRHEHLFQSLGPGRTLMTDRLVYALPAGPLGRVAARLVVARQLAHAIAGRQRLTRQVLEQQAAP